jgi:hypothetical protein
LPVVVDGATLDAAGSTERLEMKKLLLPAVILFVTAAFPVTNANAGLQTPHNIFLEKVLVGGGDPDQEFEIVATCVDSEGSDEENDFISANEGSVIQRGNSAQTCTLSEPDPQGAVPSFECSSDPEGDAVCLAGNVVQFTGSGVPEGDGDATVIVTNTFGGVTPTSDSTTTTEPSSSTTAAEAAAAAATRPSFTG